MPRTSIILFLTMFTIGTLALNARADQDDCDECAASVVAESSPLISGDITCAQEVKALNCEAYFKKNEIPRDKMRRCGSADAMPDDESLFKGCIEGGKNVLKSAQSAWTELLANGKKLSDEVARKDQMIELCEKDLSLKIKKQMYRDAFLQNYTRPMTEKTLKAKSCSQLIKDVEARKNFGEFQKQVGNLESPEYRRKAAGARDELVGAVATAVKGSITKLGIVYDCYNAKAQTEIFCAAVPLVAGSTLASLKLASLSAAGLRKVAVTAVDARELSVASKTTTAAVNAADVPAITTPKVVPTPWRRQFEGDPDRDMLLVDQKTISSVVLPEGQMKELYKSTGKHAMSKALKETDPEKAGRLFLKEMQVPQKKIDWIFGQAYDERYGSVAKLIMKEIEKARRGEDVSAALADTAAWIASPMRSSIIVRESGINNPGRLSLKELSELDDSGQSRLIIDAHLSAGNKLESKIPDGCKECATNLNGIESLNFTKEYLEHTRPHAAGTPQIVKVAKLEQTLANAKTQAEKDLILAEMKPFLRKDKPTSFSALPEDTIMGHQRFSEGRNFKRLSDGSKPVEVYEFDAPIQLKQRSGSFGTDRGTRQIEQKYRVTVCNAPAGQNCMQEGKPFKRGDVMTFYPVCGEFVFQLPAFKSVVNNAKGAGKVRETALEHKPCP